MSCPDLGMRMMQALLDGAEHEQTITSSVTTQANAPKELALLEFFEEEAARLNI